MARPVGSRSGRYGVAALIGEGDLGAVWQATDAGLNRPVVPETFVPDGDHLAGHQLDDFRD